MIAKRTFLAASMVAILAGCAGGMVGNYMDNQQREMEAALAEEQRRNAIEIERLKDETLKIDISSEVSFDFGSAALKPTFRPTLDKVAGILQRYPKTVVHVVGHTDSVGSEPITRACQNVAPPV